MHTTGIRAHRSRSRHPLSAERPPGYERPLAVSALPEKFFDLRVRLATVCPETALMYAVLENAFLCFHQQFEIEGRRSQQVRHAEQWFFSDDPHWLFSFVSVCNVLGLDPEYIRKKLEHWTQSGLDSAQGKL